MLDLVMPIRKQLLDLLGAYDPSDDNQRRARTAVLTFVRENPDCLLRSNLAGHITGSSFLLSPDLKQVMLTHHKKIGKWLQLGGHADGEPDLLGVALREAQEESGIGDIEPLMSDIFDVDVHHIKAHESVPAHYHFDIRFLFRSKTVFYKVSDESHDLAWVPLKELLSFWAEDTSLFRMATKFLAKFRA